MMSYEAGWPKNALGGDGRVESYRCCDGYYCSSDGVVMCGLVDAQLENIDGGFYGLDTVGFLKMVSDQ